MAQEEGSSKENRNAIARCIPWRRGWLLCAVAIALITPAVASGDSLECPVQKIYWVTTPSIPEPWRSSLHEYAEDPTREFKLHQGKEMVVCNYKVTNGFNANTNNWAELGDWLFESGWGTKLTGHHVLTIHRPLIKGLPQESQPKCPLPFLQTRVYPTPSPWSGVTYGFTLHQQRFDTVFVYCAYKGPPLSAFTSPSALIRPVKLDYPELKANPEAPLGLAQASGVTSVKLAAEKTNQTVACPAKVKLLGTIKVGGAGQVQYRLVHNGTPGKSAILNFTEAGSRNIHFEIPVAGPKAGTANPGGTLAQQPPAGSNTVQGLVRIDILAPVGGPKASNDVPYSVTCKQTLAAPGGLAQPSSPPGPGQ